MPNLLFIISDEHNKNIAGFAGNRHAQTPNLDALARNGVTFDNAYTPSPICIPARASLATGQHIHQHRCWSSAQGLKSAPHSWMRHLRDANHRIDSIGKLHFKSADDDHGFNDEILPMYIFNDGKGWLQALLRRDLPDYTQEAAELARDIGPGETSYTKYDRAIAERAVQWIHARSQEPDSQSWALFVSFVSPHYPLSAPFEHYRRYDGVDFPLPAAVPENHPVLKHIRQFWCYDDFFTDDQRLKAIRNYYALVSFIDDHIGALMIALQQSGQADDTLVIYTSDHGEMLGKRGLWCKSVMYEDSVGVPLLMSGAGVPDALCGTRNSTLCSLVDIAPTACHALLGEGAAESLYPKRTQADAAALQKLFTAPDESRPIISEYHDGGSPTGITMLRQDQWKLIRYAGGFPDQLFDLDSDPEELQDLADSALHQPQRQALRDTLQEIVDIEAVNAQCFAEQNQLLEALGGEAGIKRLKSFNHTPAPS